MDLLNRKYLFKFPGGSKVKEYGLSFSGFNANVVSFKGTGSSKGCLVSFFICSLTELLASNLVHGSSKRLKNLKVNRLDGVACLNIAVARKRRALLVFFLPDVQELIRLHTLRTTYWVSISIQNLTSVKSKFSIWISKSFSQFHPGIHVCQH